MATLTRRSLRKLINEVLNEKAGETVVDVKTAVDLFDAATKGVYKLKGLNWSNGVAKMNPKLFGAIGPLYETISASVWWSQQGEGKNGEPVSFFDIHFQWKYKSGGSNGTRIAEIWINSDTTKLIAYRLTDGTFKRF